MGRVHTYSSSSVAVSRRRFTLSRVVDVVVGGALLVLALPLIGILAIAVRQSSNGPVFHRDRTRDRHGRPVVVLSFRSTLDGGNTDLHERLRAVVGAADTDPTTTVGRFMRATRTDRLPRLFSVVGGSASLL